MTVQSGGALIALGLFLSVFFLQLSVILGSSGQSPVPFWKTPVETNSAQHINVSDIFDAATGKLFIDGFDYPPPPFDARKFHSVFTIPGGSISLEAGAIPSYEHVYSANMTPIAERSGFWSRIGSSNVSEILSQPIVKLYGDVIYVHMGCHYWHFQHESITQLMILRKSGELARVLAKKSNTTLLAMYPLDCESPDLHGAILTYYGLDYLLSIPVHKVKYKTIYQVVGGDLVMSGNGCFFPDSYFLQHTAKLAAKSRQLMQQRDAEARGTSESPPPSRLYIDREANYSRGILNRDELLAGLAAYNFTLFSPAEHTYTEQREAFARASLILSPSGTAFSANAIHCDPDTTILIEMFGKPIHTRTGILVAAEMKARHYYAIQPSYDRNSTTGDVYVNVSMVVMAVQRALHEQQHVNITSMGL